MKIGADSLYFQFPIFIFLDQRKETLNNDLTVTTIFVRNNSVYRFLIFHCITI